MGGFFGGFQPADDAKYQVIRDLNETAKRLVAQKLGSRGPARRAIAMSRS